MQRVFERGKFGPSRRLGNSFVLLECERDKNTKLWITEIVLLFQMHVNNYGEEKNFAFVQYMDVTSLLDNLDRVLGYVS